MTIETTQAAEILVYGAKKPSILQDTGIQAYSLHAPETKKARIKRRDDNQEMIESAQLDKDSTIAKQTKKNQQTVHISYDPLHLSDNDAIRKQQFQNRINTKESADIKHTACARQRHLAKHIVVTSDLTFYGDAYGNDFSDDPVTLCVTTPVAPNFMTREAYVDEARYLAYDAHNQVYKLKDPEAYRKTMTQLFKRWIHTQDTLGTHVLLVPLIGGGIYLNKLNNWNTGVDNRAQAQEIIFEALHAAIEELSQDKALGLKNIQEVVLCLPNADKNNYKKTSPPFNTAKKIFEDKPSNSTAALTLSNADMLDAAKKIKQKNPKLKVGLFNAGSDRTIGGAAKNPGVVADDTLEEYLANNGNLVQVQAADKNPDILYNAHYEVYPESLQCKEPELDKKTLDELTYKQSLPYSNPNTPVMPKKIRSGIQSALEKHGIPCKKTDPFITHYNQQVLFSFRDKTLAAKFVKQFETVITYPDDVDNFKKVYSGQQKAHKYVQCYDYYLPQKVNLKAVRENQQALQYQHDLTLSKLLNKLPTQDISQNNNAQEPHAEPATLQTPDKTKTVPTSNPQANTKIAQPPSDNLKHMGQSAPDNAFHRDQKQWKKEPIEDSFLTSDTGLTIKQRLEAIIEAQISELGNKNCWHRERKQAKNDFLIDLYNNLGKTKDMKTVSTVVEDAIAGSEKSEKILRKGAISDFKFFNRKPFASRTDRILDAIDDVVKHQAKPNIK